MADTVGLCHRDYPGGCSVKQHRCSSPIIFCGKRCARNGRMGREQTTGLGGKPTLGKLRRWLKADTYFGQKID